MPFPAQLAELVGGKKYHLRGAEVATKRTCEGARHHSPQPLWLRQVDLVPWDDTIGTKTAWLCGTCADNLGLLQQLLEDCDGDLPWPVRREFGNGVRALGMQGWSIYAERIAKAEAS